MHSEEHFTVCNTGRKSRTLYAECLNLSTSTGSWLVCPSFGLIFLPMLVFCVGWWCSDLSRYFWTVNSWMSPSGKKDEDRKGLAAATSLFMFLKWTGWIRISQITGLMPSLRHLWACLLPATQHDSLIQASPPSTSKSLGFVTLKFHLPAQNCDLHWKTHRKKRREEILRASWHRGRKTRILSVDSGQHDSLSGLSIWVTSAWFLLASPSIWSTYVWSKPVIFSVACWYFTGSCIQARSYSGELLARGRTREVLQVGKTQHPSARLPKTISWRKPFQVPLKPQLGGTVCNGRYRGKKERFYLKPGCNGCSF